MSLFMKRAWSGEVGGMCVNAEDIVAPTTGERTGYSIDFRIGDWLTRCVIPRPLPCDHESAAAEVIRKITDLATRSAASVVASLDRTAEKFRRFVSVDKEGS